MQTNADGRIFLLERLQYRQIKNDLEQLQPSTLSNTNSTEEGASLNKVERWYAQGSFPAAPKAIKSGLQTTEPRGAELLARGFPQARSKANPSSTVTQVADFDAELASITAAKEFIADWDLIEGRYQGGTYYFPCGTTTVVDGPFYADSAAFDGQAVLKFTDDSSLEIGYGGLTYDGSICGGPVVLTGARDSSVGDDVAWVFGYYDEPQYGDYGPALILDDCSYLSAVQDPNQFDIRYADPVAVCSGPSLPTVTITATDPVGTKGVSPVDTASFTVSRVDGDWSQPLTVVLDISGTAVNMTDYDVAAPTVVSAGQLIATIEPGYESTTITIQPRAPSAGAFEKSVLLTLVPDAAYTIGDFGSAVAYIEDPSAPTPPPIGTPNNIVAWWRGEDNGADLIGGNTGTPVNGAGYGDGFVGRGFNLGGWTQRIYIPDSPSFHLTHSLTIEGWFLWEDGWVLVHRGDDRSSLDPFVLGANPYTARLTCGVMDAGGTGFGFESSVQLPVGHWFHGALTLDDATGTLTLYQNGESVGQQHTDVRPFGALMPYDPSVCIGNVSGHSMAFGLLGEADEVSLYDRALSGGEIRAIYNAGHSGKCAGPLISTQPQSQTIAGGANSTLSVAMSAASCSPFTYQWFHNGSAIGGATSSSLQLNNVHAIDAGQYKVAVANSAGSVASSAATLTVQEVARPIFSPVGGSFPSVQNVIVTCATAGATIYYTLDGSEPDPSTSSSILSGDSVTISQNSILKAKATKSPYLASATESEGYRINTAGERPTVTISPGDGTTVLASDDIQILVEAADLDGAVSTIELFQNGVKVSESASSVLRYTVSQVFSGSYVFTARAIDDSGMVGTATPATITVTLNGAGPVVSVSSTQPFYKTSPASFIAKVTGVNPGGVSSLVWNNAPISPQTGTFPLSAPLTTQGANTFTITANGVSASTTVYFDSVTPTLAITSPLNNSSLGVDRVNVSGTFTEPNIKQLTVNGIPAFINGNTFTALNVPLVGDVVAISAGEGHCLALRADGTVVGWGLNDKGQATVPVDLADVIAISAGYYHSLALKKDGTVRAWGANESGQRDVPANLSGVAAIAAGSSHSLALTADGNLATWGTCSPYADCSVPSGLGFLRGVAASGMYSLALQNGGTVRGWGNDEFGQVDVPGTLSGVAAISAGGLHSLALLSDGTVTGWGDNGFGELEQPYALSGIVAVSAGKFGHSLALKNDGSVIGWGANWENQAIPPAGLSGVAAISASDFCSLALKVDGTIVGWGDNEYGQLSIPPVLTRSVITVTAEDLAGNVSTASVTVNRTAGAAGNLTDPVQLAANPVAGFAGLTATLTPQANVPGTILHVYYDFDGNGVSDLDAGTSLDSVQHVYAAGQFFPVVTIETSAGRFSSEGGWNSMDPNRLRINVQELPVLVSGQTISVTDPVDLKCTSDNQLYILSRSAGRIYQYDLNTSPPTQVRASSSSIGTAPSGLDVDSVGNVYVALTGDNQIAKFTPDDGNSFELDPTFGNSGVVGRSDKSSGAGPGEFNSPYDVAVANDGKDLYVSDSLNHRIQKLSSDGDFRSSTGIFGTALGALNGPKGLSLGTDGALLVADTGNHRICQLLADQLFSPAGGLGATDNNLVSPINVCSGPFWTYVADLGNNKIQRFESARSTSSSEILATLNLNGASSIVVENLPGQERLVVADTGNNRVITAALPVPDPLNTWAAARSYLQAGNLESAISQFSSETAEDYREIFRQIGIGKAAQDVAAITDLNPIYVGNLSAQYFFVRPINGADFMFVVNFIKENGRWKIRNF